MQLWTPKVFFYGEIFLLLHSNIQSWQMRSLPTLDPYFNIPKFTSPNSLNLYILKLTSPNSPNCKFLFRSTRISKVCLASSSNFGQLYDFFIFAVKNKSFSSSVILNHPLTDNLLFGSSVICLKKSSSFRSIIILDDLCASRSISNFCL